MGLTEAEAVGKMWSGVKAMIQVAKSSFNCIIASKANDTSDWNVRVLLYYIYNDTGQYILIIGSSNNM